MLFSAAWRRWSVSFLTTTSLLLTLPGCEEDDPQPVTSNTVKLEFQHNAPGDTLPLRLNTTYQTAAGRDYRLTQLLYYVSNVKLLRADGTAWAEPHSYHLLKVAGAPAGNPVVTLASVPFGSFTGVEFSLGVDSAANHHGDQMGALSPSEGMQWNWSTGYIFWRMEGDYLPGGGAANPALTYHIGFDPQYRTVRLTFPDAVEVSSTVAPEAHLFVDLNRFFAGVDLADPSQRNSMTTTDATLLRRLADNMTTLFRVTHVHNH